MESWVWVFWMTKGLEKGRTRCRQRVVPTCTAAVPPAGTPVLPGASPAAQGGDKSVKPALASGKRAAVTAREDRGGQARSQRVSGCAYRGSDTSIPRSQLDFAPSSAASPLPNSSSFCCGCFHALFWNPSWSFEHTTPLCLQNAAQNHNNPRLVTTPRPLNRPVLHRQRCASLRPRAGTKASSIFEDEARKPVAQAAFKRPDGIDVKQKGCSVRMLRAAGWHRHLLPNADRVSLLQLHGAGTAPAPAWSAPRNQPQSAEFPLTGAFPVCNRLQKPVLLRSPWLAMNITLL